MEHVFIINPVAGHGKALKFIHQIRNFFTGKNIKYIIKLTKYAGHATEIAKKYAALGANRIYSVGGDGTLNETVNGIIGSNSSLGILPGGTGNDFLKSITDNKDDILNRTILGPTHKIDVGKVNDRYFLNISSVGFDAQVAYTTNRIKKFPLMNGSFAYIAGVFLTLLKNKDYLLDLTIDDKNFTNATILITVSNGIYYGGGMKPSPNALIDDGFFDVCLINKKNTFQIIKFLPKFIKGEHNNIGGVSFYRCKTLKIKNDYPVPLNIDGEVSLSTNSSFEIIPKGINIIIPVNSSFKNLSVS